MRRFSANLGLLWQDRPLPDAIHAAHAAGFDAVECHWPYAVAPRDVKAALAATGLRMLALNTSRGDITVGECGLTALPGREVDAHRAIDEAIAYAVASGTSYIHVMAGLVTGDEAHATFVTNLDHAALRAAEEDIGLLIEPLNRYDFPGYFLASADQAQEVIRQVGAPNLRLMYDCYHLQLQEGDLSRTLFRLQDIIGHIQFAAVPDRGPPDHGEVDYGHVFGVLDDMGWDRPLGAEYRPAKGNTDASLGWMERLRTPAAP